MGTGDLRVLRALLAQLALLVLTVLWVLRALVATLVKQAPLVPLALGDKEGLKVQLVLQDKMGRMVLQEPLAL